MERKKAQVTVSIEDLKKRLGDKFHIIPRYVVRSGARFCTDAWVVAEWTPSAERYEIVVTVSSELMAEAICASLMDGDIEVPVVDPETAHA